MPQLLQPKQQLAGYEIGELVGKGGMGEVYRARQISMDRVVALKILAPRLSKQDPSFAKRFVDEARAAGRLNHPNIIAVHDVGKAPLPGAPAGTEPDLDYFSMEFVDGESVKDVIERQGICPLSLVTQVMQGMTEALVYAEAQGIVHRDIKPDNIMITNGGVVKLADLGLALQLGGEEVIGEKDGQGRSKVMGTPLYMSPEQARALPVDSRSDQYSLGATLFHMLTGKPPYKGENAKTIMRSHVFDPIPDPKAINPEVPEGWRQLTMRLLAKTPEERFQNAAAMRSALQAVVSGHGAPGNSRRVRANIPHGSKERAAPMPPWAKLLVYGFAGVVVLMVIAFAIPWGGTRKDVPPGDPTPVVVVDPKQVEADQIERVRRAISLLPSDHDKAIATLDQLSQDKSIPVGPARDLIERERAAREAARESQRRKEEKRLQVEQARERQARIAELETAWAAKDWRTVKKCLDYFSTQSDKLSISARERLTVIKTGFDRALVDQQISFIDQVMQARTTEDLKSLEAKVTDSVLAEDTKNSIREKILKRAVEVAPATPVTPVDDRKEWQAFNTMLDELRGSRSYAEIIRLAEQQAAGFPSAEGKAHVQAIGNLAKMAMKAEGALQNYIREEKPQIDIAWGGSTTRVKLLSLDDKVGFSRQEGGGNVETKLDRRTVTLPLRDLLDKAVEEGLVGAQNRPVMIAALLWVWRSPDASAIFATIPDHPGAKAVAVLERKTRIINVDAKVVRNGEELSVSYDNAKNNPWLLSDFLGEGTQLVPQGLAWTVKTAVSPNGPESELPSLRWKASLRPPFSLTAQFILQPKTYMLLFGVTSGDRTIRIGFNNINKANMKQAVALETNDEGNGYQQVKVRNQTKGTLEILSMSGPFADDGPQKVEVRVDTDYRVSLRFNDAKLIDQMKLPEGGLISPVIQSLMPKGHEVDGMSTVITSLTISGKKPSEE